MYSWYIKASESNLFPLLLFLIAPNLDPTPARPMGSNDPLNRAMQPPPDETPEQRQERLEKETEAQRVSDEIDAQLRQEGKLRTKRKEDLVRILLLGECHPWPVPEVPDRART